MKNLTQGLLGLGIKESSGQIQAALCLRVNAPPQTDIPRKLNTTFWVLEVSLTCPCNCSNQCNRKVPVFHALVTLHIFTVHWLRVCRAGTAMYKVLSKLPSLPQVKLVPAPHLRLLGP